MTTFKTISHLDLSVSDIDVSAEWYQRVFDLKNLKRSELDNRTMVVLFHADSGLIIGLNQHSVVPIDTFDERNAGLDHVGFEVSQRSDLDDWAVKLTELEVPHSPVEDTAVGSALVFRDPDNIQLEFWWTKPR